MSHQLKNIKFKGHLRFKETNGKYVFLSDGDKHPDEMDKLKQFFRKHHGLYKFLKYVISPLYFDNFLNKFIENNVEGKEGCYINLGSGSLSIGENIINVDISDYNNVHVVCDVSDLPFVDSSVDVVFILSVLEHIAEPSKTVKEIYRVLKPGGLVYCEFPFVVGFHAAPYDFNRMTDVGAKELFRQFNSVDVRVGSGPTSALLWIAQEWVAIVLSLGNRYLYRFWLLTVMCLTFPVKYLDVLFNFFPAAKNIAATFVLVGRK
ncbi:MAG: class I SAM-dependent methyltransferase [Candidatus Omnitrophica bacterium]|nr:class I SAM-dependent methyltransferase [Candidatus Omnitrophota bacterium]